MALTWAFWAHVLVGRAHVLKVLGWKDAPRRSPPAARSNSDVRQFQGDKNTGQHAVGPRILEGSPSDSSGGDCGTVGMWHIDN
jgi:hypothetical protein